MNTNGTDSLGVLSVRYGKKKSPEKDINSKIKIQESSLLVGRTFQYTTRKGECKNYVIQSYLPWNGAYRVQRLGKDFGYKTKVINMDELSNIRWLDNDCGVGVGVDAVADCEGVNENIEIEKNIKENNGDTVDDVDAAKSNQKRKRYREELISVVSPLRKKRAAGKGSPKFSSLKKKKTNTNRKSLNEMKKKKVMSPPSPLKASISKADLTSNVKKPKPSSIAPNSLKKANTSRVKEQKCSQALVSPLPLDNDTVSANLLIESRVSWLVEGDRIAFGFGRNNSLHFGTVTDCGSENEDFELERTWTVAFDMGEIYAMDSWNLTEGVELYDKIKQREDSHPLPESEDVVQVGDRIAFAFGMTGVSFGFVKNCRNEEKGEFGNKKWTVKFDDGQLHDFGVSEMNKGRDLYRRIRKGKSARSLLWTGGKSGAFVRKRPTVSTKRLLSMTGSNDRIAYDFGAAGVFFGCVEASFASTTKPRKDWRWDILFDDGDRYKFDCFEMARSVALYEKTREDERNDPLREEKIRKLREDHLAEKEAIERKLPEFIKNRFRETGFGRWGKTFLPILFLGPYDIPPGPLRDEWFEAFAKVGRKGMIPQIVYWFGTSVMNGYSIIQDATDILSLVQAKKMGLVRPKTTNTNAAEKHNYALHLLKKTLAKPRQSRLPQGRVREIYEHLEGPNPDRLLAEVESNSLQYNYI